MEELSANFCKWIKKNDRGFGPKVDGFDHFNLEIIMIEKIYYRKTAAIMVETIMGEGGIKLFQIGVLKI